MPTVKAIPTGYHALTPCLVVKGPAKAIYYYKQAFGAQERERMPGPNGTIMHAELKIGDSTLMLADEMPQMGTVSPASLKGSPSSLYLYVEQVDAVFDRAVQAGATVQMPVADMFWGDRAGSLVDPFGHRWMIGTHIQDLSSDEIRRRGQEFMAARKPA